MPMDAILCSLSPKRLALVEEDPEVLGELLEARHDTDIPGLLDLGKTWHALDILLGDGKDEVLGDALVGRTGKKIKAGNTKARLLEPPRVAAIYKALAAQPKNMVQERYGQLYGKTVHGGYGQDLVSPDDKQWLRGQIEKRHVAEIAELTEALLSVIELYEEAAEKKYSMMSIII